MTREHAKKVRDAFNAFCEGRTIQWKAESGERWEDTEEPTFFEGLDFRVKPEPKLFAIRTCASDYSHRAISWMSQGSRFTMSRECTSCQIFTALEVVE